MIRQLSDDHDHDDDDYIPDLDDDELSPSADRDNNYIHKFKSETFEPLIISFDIDGVTSATSNESSEPAW